VKLVQVNVSVLVEPGVVAESSFAVRDDLVLRARTNFPRLETLQVVADRLHQAFWEAYSTVTQPPVEPEPMS
jgi:hypothetical protein